MGHSAYHSDPRPLQTTPMELFEIVPPKIRLTRPNPYFNRRLPNWVHSGG